MNFLKTNSIILSVLMATSPLAFAQQQQNELQQNTQEAEMNWSEFSDANSQLNQAVKSTFGDENKMCTLLRNKLSKEETVSENGEVKKITRMQKELNRFKVSIPVKVDFDFLKDKMNAGIGYKLEAQPTYVEGEQQRLDIYWIKLGANTSIGGSLMAKVTIARVFKGNNAKIEALTACPYWINKVPTKASEIQSKLKDGETVRVEISGLAKASKDKDSESGKNKSEIGISYSREAVFLADFHKHNASWARARFIGLKNRGIVEVGISGGKSLINTNNSVLNKLSDSLSVHAGISVQIGDTLFNKYPIDSLMADYLFKTSDTKALAALDQIFTNMKNTEFLSLFNPLKKDAELGQSLIKNAALAEETIEKETQVEQNNKTIIPLFRGRLTSQTLAYNISGGFSGLATGKIHNGGFSTLVRKYVNKNKNEYYILENSFNEINGKSLFGRNETNYNFELDLLVESNENFEAEKMLDIVLKNEIFDKSIDLKNSRDYLKTYKAAIPKSLLNENAVDNFIPRQEHTNARFRYQLNFGAKGLAEVKNYGKAELVRDLQNFLEFHPDRKKGLMNLPSDIRVGEGATPISFGEYVHNLGTSLHTALAGNTNAERMAAFKSLKSDLVFQKWIMGEFIGQIIPEDKANDLIQIKADFASDQSKLKHQVIGKNSVTEVYEAISFMKKVINDRTMDLRLEELVDNENETSLMPSNYRRAMIESK